MLTLTIETTGDKSMKALYIAAASLALMLSPAHAVQWIGGASIVAQAGTCPFGNAVGDRFFVRFRPSGLGNDANSNLNFFDDSFAQGHRLNNGRFTTTFKRVTATSIGGGSGSNTDTFVRFTSQNPATLTATTPFINIVGQIRGYDFQPNCTVTFRAAVTLRVEN